VNTEIKKLKFRVYEIENSDDLGDAINELLSYGAEIVNVLSIDLDNSESAMFEVMVPETKIQGFIVDVRMQMCV
jgi:hypothetical protein